MDAVQEYTQAAQIAYKVIMRLKDEGKIHVASLIRIL